MNNSLGIYIFSSVGESYLAAQLTNLLSDQDKEQPSPIEVVELSSSGGKGQLLVRGPLEEIKLFQDKVVSSSFDVEQFTLIENLHNKLLPSYYNIENTKPKKHFLFVEGIKLVELFSWTQELLNYEFEILEFRHFKGEGANSYVIATSDVISEPITQLFSKMKDSGAKVTWILNAQPLIKNLY